MKICAACCNELPQSSFSKKQWKLKQYERRCTDCINSNRELQLKPPPKTNIVKEDDTPTCYICLDDGPDELGGVIRRDCSCRGGSGYVHISCLVKYAEQQFRKVQKELIEDCRVEDPWRHCPNCHQSYCNAFSMEMAQKYLAFAEVNMTHNPVQMMRALVVRLESLTSRNNHRSPSQTIEAEQVAESILHKVRQMKVRGIRIHSQCRVYEAFAYEILGCMMIEEEGDVKQTLEYLEKSLEVSRNNDLSTKRAEGLIAMVKSGIAEGEELENLLKQQKVMYEHSVQSKGEVQSIKPGILYANKLKEHDCGVEAEKLMNKLYEFAVQNHGPDHDVTNLVLSYKFDVKTRFVSVSSDVAGDQQSFQALSFNDYSNGDIEHFRFIRYDDSFKRCIVKDGPDSSDDTNTFSLSTDDIIFALGTPVLCQDKDSDLDGDIILIGDENMIPKLGDIRSWNHETKCYTILLEDGDHRVVHSSKLLVPRCICSDCLKGKTKLLPSDFVTTFLVRGEV